jgi:WD40 repeat protein
MTHRTLRTTPAATPLAVSRSAQRTCTLSHSLFLTVAILSLLSFAPLRADEPPITSIAFAPDGASVVLASQRGIELRTWPDLEVIDHVKTGMPHVGHVAFSPTGDVFAVAGGNPAESGRVELYSWPHRRRLAVDETHDDLVYRIAWGADGAWATASADQTVSLHWASETKSPTSRVLEGHSRGVMAVVILADGEYVVSAGLDQSLRVWEFSTGRLVRTLDNHTAAVHALAVAPPSEEEPREGALPQLASAGADRTVRIWQPTIGRLVRFARLPAEPLDIAWAPDAARIVAACDDGHVRVIDPLTAEVTADIPAIEGWAYCVAIAPDGRHALVGGEGGQLKVVSLKRESD